MRKVKFYSEVDIFNIQEFLNIKIQTFENTPQDNKTKSLLGPLSWHQISFFRDPI